MTGGLLDPADGMDVVSFSLDARRYTFRCADFFISGLDGGLRSARRSTSMDTCCSVGLFAEGKLKC